MRCLRRGECNAKNYGSYGLYPCAVRMRYFFPVRCCYDRQLRDYQAGVHRRDSGDGTKPYRIVVYRPENDTFQDPMPERIVIW